MPFPYQAWLRQAAYEYLETQELDERERLLAWIEQLGLHPFREGDCTERGSDGRDWQVSIVAAHAIIWWADDAVCEIKVVGLRPADR